MQAPMIFVEQPKMPKRVDAVQWNGNNVSEVTTWISKALADQRIFRTGEKVAVQAQAVGAATRIKWASPGDYILQHTDGRLGVLTVEQLHAQYEAEEIYITTRLKTKADQASNQMLGALKKVDGFFNKSGININHNVARLVSDAIKAAEL